MSEQQNEPELNQLYDETTGQITIWPVQGYTRFRVTASCELLEQEPCGQLGEDND